MRLTYVIDVAGRVSRATIGAEFVSAGGVCLPTGALRSIRRRLPPDLPKWRNASDEHLRVVLDTLFREAFSVTAVVFNKATPQWPTFWAAAEEVHRRTASLGGGSIAFLKAATQVRYLLFSQAAALTGAHAVRENCFPRLARKDGCLLLVDEQHIYDREIDGPDNVDAFRATWEARNAEQPLTKSLGLQIRATSITFETEQREPLLLLADYVAGIAQSNNSTANTLDRSNVSRDAAHAAHRELLRWKRYAEVKEDFSLDYFEIFPAFKEFSPSAASQETPSK